MPKAYIIARRAILYRRYITRSDRNGYHCKKPLLSGRQKRFFTWRRERDSFLPTRKYSRLRHTLKRLPDTPYFLPSRSPFFCHRQRSNSKPGTDLSSVRIQMSHSIQRKQKQGAVAPCFCLWRRERDSNPRNGISVHTISNRAP